VHHAGILIAQRALQEEADAARMLALQRLVATPAKSP